MVKGKDPSSMMILTIRHLSLSLFFPLIICLEYWRSCRLELLEAILFILPLILIHSLWFHLTVDWAAYLLKWRREKLGTESLLQSFSFFLYISILVSCPSCWIHTSCGAPSPLPLLLCLSVCQYVCQFHSQLQERKKKGRKVVWSSCKEQLPASCSRLVAS